MRYKVTDEMRPLSQALRILFIAPAARAGTVQYTHNLATEDP